MTTELDIEDIKHEITRWAVTKSPNLYQHFAEYLGIDRKEVSKLFKANEGIQAHINKYFQEERVQESEERQQQLEKDLAQLNDFIQTVIAEKRTITTEQVVKATGIARCNVKFFAFANSEIWRAATAIKSFDERAQLKAERHALLLSQQREAKKLRTEQREAERKEKAERHALVLAQHAETKKLKAERKEAQTAQRAIYNALAEFRAKNKAIEKARLEATEQKQRYYDEFASTAYSSNAVCEFAYERGRLVKKIKFNIAVVELEEIGYEGYVNFLCDAERCFGIYVQKHAHIGDFPSKKRPNFHTFSLTWNKRLCEEPRANKMAPINFKLVETGDNKGLMFMLPEQFFMSYIPD